ncbi:hypothetical protein NX059_004733 [Plenodomus lindquistii]|nr:hypothetical protein NX059_004733 [Plenodomus lindquistii]
MQDDYNTNRGHGPKVAISRIDRGPPPPPKGNAKNREERVTRACKLCRKRKVRCSGEVPRCGTCQGTDSECVYEQARRDRLKESTDLNASLVTLLKNLSTRVDKDDQEIIRATLEDAEDDLISHTPPMSVKSHGGKRPRSVSAADDGTEGEQHGEAFVTASVGSNEHVDFLGENLMRSREAMETGYIGQNSEIQWLRSVQRQSESGNTDPFGQHYGPPGTSRAAADQRAKALHERRQQATPGSMGHVTDTTFYLDSDNIEVDIAVDPYEMPDPHLAERLFNCYMDTVHDTFPLMPMNFEDQFRRYITSIKNAQAFQIPDQWRAMMGDERDHLLYMTRGVHLLGLRNTVMIISGPNLNLVQALGALAFYFLVIGHVSRAWVMIGLSMRLALALGLHLRNEDPTLNDAKREPLVRTWWCLHSIECLLSSITGRPPVVAAEDCTVSLPKPTSRTAGVDSRHGTRRRTDYGSPSFNAATEEGSASAAESRYFLNRIHVTLISQRVLLSLYSPRTAAQNWVYVQKQVTVLLGDLEEWAKTALPGHASQWDPTTRTANSRKNFLLRISHLSTKILITRPCLCRIERRISHESDESINFNAKSAETCVEAARELAMLFPDRPDSTFMYTQGPWWDVVHIIMQSLAVLLLDMAYRGKKAKGKGTDPHINCIKRLLRWLRAMEAHDAVAKRAYHVIWKILKTCAPVLQDRANEILAEDEEFPNQRQPRMYTPEDIPNEQKQHGLWSMGENPNNILEPSQPLTFEEESFRLQVTSPMQGAEYLQYSHLSQVQMPWNMTFGNPFMTSFDQGAPVLNMQNLWEQPSTFDEGVDYTGAGYSQASQALEPNLQGYWPMPGPSGSMAESPETRFPPNQPRAPQ